MGINGEFNCGSFLAVFSFEVKHEMSNLHEIPGLREMKLPVTLVAEPTMREKNGLAMSSRNMRLTPVQREEAAAIYAMLTHAAQSIKEGLDVPEVLQKAESELADFDCKPEYIVLCDAETLLPLERYDPDRKAILLTAVWWGDVRLIDNLVF